MANKKLEESHLDDYTTENKYKVTYIDSNGNDKEISFTPSKNTNIAGVQKELGESYKDFFKLKEIKTESKKVIEEGIRQMTIAEKKILNILQAINSDYNLDNILIETSPEGNLHIIRKEDKGDICTIGREQFSDDMIDDLRMNGLWYDKELDGKDELEECELLEAEEIEEFEVADLKKKAQGILPAEDIDTHDGNLYLRKTDKSTELINKMKNHDCGLISTFKDNIEGDIWYDIPFANWEDDLKTKSKKEERKTITADELKIGDVYIDRSHNLQKVIDRPMPDGELGLVQKQLTKAFMPGKQNLKGTEWKLEYIRRATEEDMEEYPLIESVEKVEEKLVDPKEIENNKDIMAGKALSVKDKEIILFAEEKLEGELGKDWKKKSLIDIEEIVYDAVYEWGNNHDEEDINAQPYYKEIKRLIGRLEESYDTMAFAQNLPMSYTSYVDNQLGNFMSDYDTDTLNKDQITEFIEEYKSDLNEDELEEFADKLAVQYVKYALDKRKGNLEEGKVTTPSGEYEYSELQEIENKMKQAFKDYWNGKITGAELEIIKKELKLSQGEVDSCQYMASMEEKDTLDEEVLVEKEIKEAMFSAPEEVYQDSIEKGLYTESLDDYDEYGLPKLERPYEISYYEDKDIAQIRGIRPYDLTDYSYAKARISDMMDGEDFNWVVYDRDAKGNPYKVGIVPDVYSAVDLMKELDSKKEANIDKT